MTGQATKWRTDDPCPACGTGLITTDDGYQVSQECPLCGWSASWQAALDTTSREA